MPPGKPQERPSVGKPKCLNQKPKKPVIILLDVGFEDAQKLVSFARKKSHRNKRFMGVEWTKQENLRTRYHNLKLTYGDALSKLKRLPAASVKIITADFLFTEFKIGGKESSDFGWRRASVETAYEKQRVNVMKQVARVLLPNGRFIVTEYAENASITVRLLKDAGFEVYSVPLKESEVRGTKFMEMILDRLKKHPEEKREFWPIKITARKKGA